MIMDRNKSRTRTKSGDRDGDGDRDWDRIRVRIKVSSRLSALPCKQSIPVSVEGITGDQRYRGAVDVGGSARLSSGGKHVGTVLGGGGWCVYTYTALGWRCRRV